MPQTHAVVIGGSIAGLLAARVLSARFDRVTLIDRDGLPAGCDNRQGVPQGRHGHGLLASGLGALERLFPHLERDLANAGGVQGDVIGDVRWFQQGHYKAKFPSGLTGILLSRPLLEGTIRQRVREIPNVVVMDRTHVTSLLTDERHLRVTGVLLQQARRTRELRDIALVVDASGRASRAPEWLQGFGYEPPKVDTVEVGLGYTTRTFRRLPHHLGGDVGAIVGPLPPHQRRVGFMLAMEADRWIVTLGGWLGDHAPTNPQAFEAFARSLTRPDIYDVIRDAEPLTSAVTYSFPANLRRRYEHLRRVPARFLVTGDAVCSFNPFYGQGMSVAALEAEALDRCLATQPDLEGVWQPFMQAVGRIVDTPWTIAAGSDFAFPGVTGSKPPATDLINWYMSHLHRAAGTDRDVCRAFFDVANLLAPATRLFAPGIVARVVRQCVWPSAPTRQPGPGVDKRARHNSQTAA
jgi:2-polyprenyl-6-methoxyphenol hydroxylase-like FAD-dependent oxidoreductase